MSNVVRALHKRWQATGYDWERLLAVEMCQAGVGESAFGNFGRIFGVADCWVLNRSYFADFGRVFDGSAAVLSPMSSQGARDR